MLRGNTNKWFEKSSKTLLWGINIFDLILGGVGQGGKMLESYWRGETCKGGCAMLMAPADWRSSKTGNIGCVVFVLEKTNDFSRTQFCSKKLVRPVSMFRFDFSPKERERVGEKNTRWNMVWKRRVTWVKNMEFDHCNAAKSIVCV